jgi:hypothetical protein
VKLTPHEDDDEEFDSYLVSGLTATDVGDVGERMTEFLAKWGSLVGLDTADAAALPARVARRYEHPPG